MGAEGFVLPARKTPATGTKRGDQKVVTHPFRMTEIEVFVVFFGGLIGLFILSSVLAIRKDNAKPAETILVQVVHLSVAYAMWNPFKDVGSNVIFRTEDGKNFNVLVNDSHLYYHMNKGVYGMLTHRGRRCLDFVPTHPTVTSQLSLPDKRWGDLVRRVRGNRHKSK
jgi:hypothetical protein